jgi:hypothetical protein
LSVVIGALAVALAAGALIALETLSKDEAAAAVDAKPPSIADLQAAYDRAAAKAGELHDKDLKIVGIDCRPSPGRRFSCQIGFVKTDDDLDRVFLDAALVERAASREWTLLRGLCRRLI